MRRRQKINEELVQAELARRAAVLAPTLGKIAELGVELDKFVEVQRFAQTGVVDLAMQPTLFEDLGE